MKLSDTLLLTFLAAIWGGSFIFMRATVDAFGPVALITVRVVVAELFLVFFLLKPQRRKEFVDNWRPLAWIGVASSAIPFSLLAYSSISLTAGMVSILNAMTPIFTAWIAHLWLKDKMTNVQFLGLLVSFLGLIILVWDKVTVDISSWLPIAAGVLAASFYGIASNGMKKYLAHVSITTKTAGSMFFASLFMLMWLPFFMPDLSKISSLDWLYAILLGGVCTSLAYFIFFRLIRTIGPTRSTSVTFIIPIFSFLWAYLLLGEVVTLRMWVATAVILLGMALVLKIVSFQRKGIANTLG